MSKKEAPLVNYLLAVIAILVALMYTLVLPENIESNSKDSYIPMTTTGSIGDTGSTIQGNALGTNPQQAAQVKPGDLNNIPLK